jgi:DNA-binding response OmpR family regulator
MSAEKPSTEAEPVSALLVDDDLKLAQLLQDYLSGHEVSVHHVMDGALGLARLAEGGIDVVLLDVMLPGDDGFEVCRKIRAKYTVPIVMLTARGDDHDRIVGLELGADDYLPKPFNPRELLARLRAVLRRAKPREEAKDANKITVGPLVIEVAQMKASLDGKAIALTSFEFRVLVELAKRAGQAVPRETLASAVTGEAYDPSVDRSLDVHVSHLRQKLESDPRDPQRIKTVRGVGYMLVRP